MQKKNTPENPIPQAGDVPSIINETVAMPAVNNLSENVDLSTLSLYETINLANTKIQENLATACSVALKYVLEEGRKTILDESKIIEPKVFEEIFKLKQNIVHAYSVEHSDCTKPGEEIFYKILEFENKLVEHKGSGIVQKMPNTFKEELANEFKNNFFESKYIKGNILDLNSGDLILSANLKFDLDISRAFTNVDNFYSQIGLVYKDNESKKINVIYVDSFDTGVKIIELMQFYKNNNYAVTVLRPKDRSVGENAGSALYDFFKKMSADKLLKKFDLEFKLENTKNFYPGELITFSYESQKKDFFNLSPTTEVNIPDDSFISKFLNRPTLDVVLPKNFLFLGKFDLIGEWIFYPDYRLNHLSYLMAKVLMNIKYSDLKFTKDTRLEILEFFWQYRENSIVRSVFDYLGVNEKMYKLDNFLFAYYGQQRLKGIQDCLLTIAREDFSRFKSRKIGWIADELLTTRIDSCVKKSFN